MKLLNGYSTGVRALVRTGRHGRDAVQWSEPFVCSLSLQKDRANQVCAVALEGHDFAEFDPRYDAEGENLLNSEDYLLEIIRIPVHA